MTVGDLKGMTVMTADDTDVGSPVDFIETGNGISMILSEGGFLGIGNTQVAIPLDTVSVEGDMLRLGDMTEEQIEAAQDFEYSDDAALPDDRELTLQ